MPDAAPWVARVAPRDHEPQVLDGDAGVDGRRLDRAMAEQLLHVADVGAASHELGGARVAQGMASSREGRAQAPAGSPGGGAPSRPSPVRERQCSPGPLAGGVSALPRGGSLALAARVPPRARERRSLTASSPYLDRLLVAAMKRRTLDTLAVRALMKATHLLGLALAQRLREYRDSGDPVLASYARRQEEALHVGLLRETIDVLTHR